MTEIEIEEIPEDQRCIWPGCPRRRAAGRSEGSGRQKEYCLLADPPGNGPVHNARNRWARRQKEAAADSFPGAAAGEAGAGHGQEPRSVRDNDMPVTSARRRVSDLLEQARCQHAAALAAFTAERDAYARVAAEFEVLADPAALDLELTAAGVRAGRDVAAAAEDAASAQRAQRAAEAERDDALRRAAEADAAAEQFAADTEGAEAAARDAERILDERTAEFDAARGELALRTREAEEKADAAANEAAAVKTAADETVAKARAQAERAVKQARARAEEAIGQAVRRADAAAADAREQVTRIREEAAGQAAAAQEEVRDARKQAEQATAEARREIADARSAAERTRRDAETARERAHERILAAETATAAAKARVVAIEQEIAQLRDERTAEFARLETVHQSAVAAERARADRAEQALDAMTADSRPGTSEGPGRKTAR